jgi:hypothetical protein
MYTLCTNRLCINDDDDDLHICLVVSTFAEPTLHRAGIDDQLIVDLTGAGFQVAIVVGGIVVGG